MSLVSNIPVIKEPSEEEKTLSSKSKIELVEAEIHQLHEFCLNSGLNAKQIEVCASPILSRPINFSKLTRRLIFFSLFVGFLAFLLTYEPTHRFITIQARLISIKVIPYWDWTRIYDEECFINNPYFEMEELNPADCDACLKLDKIPHVSNASLEMITDQHLVGNKPVIVTDSTEEWLAMKLFNLDFLIELYSHDPELSSQTFCQFLSSFDEMSSPQEHFNLIKDIDSKTTWQTSWENCNPVGAKVIRRFYKRPYFLPPMAEAAESNWIFVASGRKTGRKGQNNAVMLGGRASWIAQIRGEVIVNLEPIGICDQVCNPVKGILKAGQILLFTSKLWEFTFYPVGEEIGISIGSSVIWDRQ